MGIIVLLAIIATFGLFITTLLVLILEEGRIEVDPMSAVVYKNIWTGRARALLPGTFFIIPGIERRLVPDVTLKNEPSDPDITQVVTADPIQIGVDYIIYTMQIKYNPEDPTTWKATRESVVKAATVIDYKNRQALVIDRIEAELQAAFGTRRFPRIYTDAEGLNRRVLSDIANEVNNGRQATNDLPTIRGLKDSIEAEWGFYVEIKIEDVDFPGKVQEAITEAVTAPREGAAIKAKADAAGVDPRWIAVGEMVADAVSIFEGKEK